MEGKCLLCNNIIPEQRQICSHCEQTIAKIGAILQTQNATEEVVQQAYDALRSSITNINNGGITI